MSLLKFIGRVAFSLPENLNDLTRGQVIIAIQVKHRIQQVYSGFVQRGPSDIFGGPREGCPVQPAHCVVEEVERHCEGVHVLAQLRKVPELLQAQLQAAPIMALLRQGCDAVGKRTLE